MVAHFLGVVFFRAILCLLLCTPDIRLRFSADVTSSFDLLLAAFGLHELTRGFAIVAIGGLVAFAFVSRGIAHELLLSTLTVQERADAKQVPGMLVSMYWILAALFLLVTLTVPRLRPLAVVGCVILGGMLTWAVIQRVRAPDPAQLQERGRPASPAALVRSIPLEQVELKDARLTGGGAPFKFTGSVANRSSTMQLKSLMLDISRRDCHASALDPSGCVLNWRVRHWIELSAPPNQERQFAVSIWARGDAPRALGTVHDEFEIVAAHGELVHAE